MGIIRQLSPTVINQIAAGEVIERPASVVKELLENAIDAQATRIELSVERGGKDLIRVSDDGVGMAADDLLLAFQPHATSKLRGVDDLFQIKTLGFRGEALAAIAEISKVRCQTRQAGTDEGNELLIEGGSFGAIKSCGGPIGTVMEVRNLFFNTPVRRTFLKSDMTEAGHVIEMFSRVALAHPEVHLTFRSGNKVVHDLPAVAGTRERIATFFGRELAESLLWVEGNLGTMHLWGYVAHPSQSRSTAKGQFLFIDGRYVRDRSLSHALNEAYRGLLMVGRMPVAFLHLNIPADEVDVNVHPTKIEVRFRDPQRVYSHLLSTLRQTFLKSDLHAKLQPTDAPPARAPAGIGGGEASPSRPVGAGVGVGAGAGMGIGVSTALDSGLGRFNLSGVADDRQTVAGWFEPSAAKAQFAPAPPAWARSLPIGFDVGPGEAFDEFSEVIPPSRSAPVPYSGVEPPLAPEAHSRASNGSEHARPTASEGESNYVEATSSAEAGLPTESHAPLSNHRDLGLKAIQVHDSYLIAETGDGMIVIDQHALHERILYEELRARVARGQVESQRLLVPEPVDLTPAEAALLLERTDVLGQLGLEIEPFGGDTILVRSVPAMLPHVVPERLVRDLADHFRTQPLPPTRDGLLAEILHMVACKAAVKAGQPLTPTEVSALLERRHLVADSHHCPHGRPTALVFTKADLEKQFGRI